MHDVHRLFVDYKLSRLFFSTYEKNCFIGITRLADCIVLELHTKTFTIQKLTKQLMVVNFYTVM